MNSMAGYTKLFNSILASTVWSEPVETRIVWITLLAMAGKDGIAEGSLPGLAVFARLDVAAVEIALARLCAPDPHSRSKEFEGRRIEVVDGGWKILNHGKYRAKLNADERREYNRVKQSEYRQRLSNNVNHSEHSVHIAEAEAEADTKTKLLLAQRDKRASLGDGEIVEKIPALGGTEVEIKESHVKELERLYPAVDVPQTLREIRAWNLANPTKRKTSRGIARHINTWMMKVQNG